MRGETGDGRSGRYGFTVGFTRKQWRHGSEERQGRFVCYRVPDQSLRNAFQVEIAETQTPLLFWRKELREGIWRRRQDLWGGLGQVLEIESACNKPFQVLASFDRISFRGSRLRWVAMTDRRAL